MKKITTILPLLLFCAGLFAQDRTITGMVTSGEDDAPIIGASVVAVGTTIGTITDFDGRYSIIIPETINLLRFTFIGLQTEEVEIGDLNVIDMVMIQGKKELEEVVVVGYSTKPKGSITGSIATVGYAVQELDGAAVNQVKTENVANALSGKLAGVQVKVNNNIGGSTNVLIRGSSSITQNNQALFVIDGVPISNAMTNKDFGAQSQGRQAYDYGNAVSDINPNDIESISVLKGAAATARLPTG